MAFDVPTAAEIQRLFTNSKFYRRHGNKIVAGDLKYAIVLLELTAATTPDDFAGIATHIKTDSHVDDVKLISAEQTPELVDETDILRVHVSSELSQRAAPEPE